MGTSKMLFATDFSPFSDAALELATSLARDRGATLVIAHVAPVPYVTDGGDLLYPIQAQSPAELEELLSKVKPSDKSIVVEHRLLSGDPADAIIQLAELEHLELIIIGTHGRRGLSRLLMGSVAESIVRGAPCPVLIVKQPLKNLPKPEGTVA